MGQGASKQRPYFTLGLSDLSNLFDAYIDQPQKLKVLEFELEQRSSPSAKRLKERICSRLDELKSQKSSQPIQLPLLPDTPPKDRGPILKPFPAVSAPTPQPSVFPSHEEKILAQKISELEKKLERQGEEIKALHTALDQLKNEQAAAEKTWFSRLTDSVKDILGENHGK